MFDKGNGSCISDRATKSKWAIDHSRTIESSIIVLRLFLSWVVFYGPIKISCYFYCAWEKCIVAWDICAHHVISSENSLTQMVSEPLVSI